MIDTQLKERVRQASQELQAETVRNRRHLHANPELSFEEHQTADFVAKNLTEIGVPFQTGVAKTGVVGMIEGGAGDGPTLALRADMDALPILEENPNDYCSRNPGKMHACGHDAHTASLLTATKILWANREHLKGRIKLIFQPSEEKLPGGASVMMAEGVLEQPKVQNIVGQHVMPLLPVGKIGIRSGMYMASADEIYLTVHGKGGHGAQPHTTIDPVAITAQLITALQQVISRNADPRLPSVLTFGKVIAEGATNIIPEKVYLEGTFRTFSEPWRAQAHERITKLVHGLVEGMGGKAELDIRRGYPVLTNDPTLTAGVHKSVTDYMGAENVVDLDLWMASEDFAYYTQAIPGCFYRLGTRNEAKGIVHGLHTPKFDIDEDSLAIAPGLMAWVALTLQQQAS
jgi:amidohydrolase